MPLKDLSGKTVYDLDRETFEKLFCRNCHEYEECDRNERKIFHRQWAVGPILSEELK